MLHCARSRNTTAMGSTTSGGAVDRLAGTPQWESVEPAMAAVGPLDVPVRGRYSARSADLVRPRSCHGGNRTESRLCRERTHR
jgi:hypothetical protein